MALPICALVLAVFAVYYPAMGYGFVYDDAEQILRNRWVLSFSNVLEAFTTHTFGFKEESYQAISYRPMFFVMYAVEYALFGYAAWGWHLVNVLMHALDSVLVFLVLRHMISSEWHGNRPTLAAFAPALVFAVHPMNAESVSWLATIPELTFTFLCLAAFYLEARSIDGKERRAIESVLSRAVPALFLLAALLLKETAVVLPVLVFVYDVSRKGFQRLFSLERVLRYIPYAAAIAVYAGMRVWALKGEMTPSVTLHSFLSPYEFALNAIVLLARYFKSLAFPLGEPPLQLLEPVFSIAEPRAAVSAAAVIAVPLLLAYLLSRFTRLWLLILVVMILPLLPTLYSPAISRFPFADRYLYFPSVGVAMLLSVVIAFAFKEQRRWGAWAVAVLLALSLPFAALARDRSSAWESDRTLWGAALAAQPGNYVAVHSIAMEHLKVGRFEEAVRLFESSLDANRSSAHPDESMILLTLKVLPQACIKAGYYGKAQGHLEDYLKMAPDDALALYNHGLLMKIKGNCPDAVDQFQRAAVFSETPALKAMIYSNLGECQMTLGMRDEAVASFREGLKYSPGDSLMLGQLASLGAAP